MMNAPWLTPNIQSLLSQALDAKLHHAVLLQGPHGIGKAQALDVMAMALLCDVGNGCGECKSCKLYLAQSHPDKLALTTDTNTLSVDNIRELIRFLQTKAQASTRIDAKKVVVIPDAHRMTEAASNALLKALEEPQNNSFILLSVSKETLPATILSRVMKVACFGPEQEEAKAWLSNTMGKEDALNQLAADFNYLYKQPYLLKSALEQLPEGVFADIQSLFGTVLSPLNKRKLLDKYVKEPLFLEVFLPYLQQKVAQKQRNLQDPVAKQNLQTQFNQFINVTLHIPGANTAQGIMALINTLV